ncbi:TlpA family protein disulfide reductase [Pedobacter insulae]|uniref:Thiol-disulfide isomerase or thioredoxin n=1 Tax=Pedobacter insulae TaxID=414048 RepID=A0A1I2ZZM0_9SPHI|nr:TlpA disulfide reductase family protein [Pedobacter insulae]SFH43307.1 Thiol-disulfide isomerase or thioredoxin [Pedobacter insulae]
MRRLILLLLCLTLGFVAVHAKGVKTKINCTVHGKNNSGVFLYQLRDGNAISLGFKRPDENGNCNFDIQAKEGVYFLKKAGGKGNGFKITIYMKPGEQKQLDLYYDKNLVDFDSFTVTKPNAETKRLQTWLNSMNDYKHAVANKPGVGRSKYAEFEKYAASFLEENKTANPYFNGWLNDKVAIDLKYLKVGNYFGLGRLNSIYDVETGAEAFYKQLLDKNIINDVRILRSEHGMQLLDFIFGFWKYNEAKNTQKVLENTFSPENGAKINNNLVKVAFLLYKMPGIKEFETFVKHVQPYKNVFVTAEQKIAYEQFYNALGPFAKGSPGYNFELKDVNDRTYTLASFKGKIVVIDVWAMWCAPCLNEKPVMDKIAEEFKGKEVEFIGISVDGHVQKKNWKDFVKRNGFKHVELLTQFDESLFKFYKITTIPRFLIFDREGKIITVDAPYPSNPGFKKLIETALAGK